MVPGKARPRSPRRPGGVTALALFFLAGSLIALTSSLALLFSAGPLDAMWRLNPPAREAFRTMGPWAVVLLLGVSAACWLSALGLWGLRPWGRWAATALLAVDLAGDTGNAILRHDPRTLVGLPIAGAMIWYLQRLRVRRSFASSTPGEEAADPVRRLG